MITCVVTGSDSVYVVYTVRLIRVLVLKISVPLQKSREGVDQDKTIGLENKARPTV